MKNICPDCDLIIRGRECSCGYKLPTINRPPTYTQSRPKRDVYGPEYVQEAKEMYHLAEGKVLTGEPLANAMEAMEKKWPGLGWEDEASAVRLNAKKREEIKNKRLQA